MKKIGIMLSAASALMMAGCAKDMTETPEVGVAGTLYATVEGSDNSTRVGFDKDGTFYWSEGDQIGVFNMPAAWNEAYDIRGAKFDIQSGAGTGSASFSGQVDGSMDGDVVIYPYNEDIKLEVSQGSRPYAYFYFPSKYTYTKVDTDFFSAERGKGNSFNAYMWGVVKDNTVELKHLAGVFCVKIDKMPSESGVFEFSASETFTSGTASLGYTGSNGEAEYIDYPEIQSNGGAASVTIEFSGAEAGKPGVFYIPVPTGDYTNVTVSISDQDGGNKISIPCGNYHIDRAMLKAIYPKVAAGSSTTAGSAMDVVTAIGYGEKAITVAPDVTDLTVCGNDNNDPISISYAQIPNGDLSIGYDPNLPIASQLVVAMPYDEGNSAAPNVTVDMFNTSVTLAATTGKAVYGTVTLEASGELLVVDSGVTVSELVIRRSNIRVKRDSHIKRIVNQSALEVKIYYEEGAWLPIDIPQGVTVVYE